jgi:hypothetical protein
MDPEPRDRGPAQDIPVQEQPREGNGERRECRPAAEQPRDRAPTPPPRGLTRDNNRRANEGANVDANPNANAPLHFRRASQNLAATTMLLRGCPEAATSEERRVRQQLKALLEATAAQQAERSASRHCLERGRAGASSTHGPNPPPSQHREREEGVEPLRRRSGAASGPTATCGTPLRPDDGPKASTSIATPAHTTTTIADAGGAMIATTTATTARHQAREVHELLARASGMRGSSHTFSL